MSTILVIEDNLIQRKNLVKILESFNRNFIILEAANVEEALKIANENDIDLFYIDICLDNDSGLELASEIRKIPKYKLVWIVFITTHVSYIVEAFKKIHCYDYIMKPYDKEIIEKTTVTLLEKDILVTSKKNIEKRYISFDIGDTWIKISTSDIIFVEVFLRASYIHTENQVYKIEYTSLKKIISLLHESNFIQCHRSYVVNLDYIERLEKNSTQLVIILRNYNKVVPVGKIYKCHLEKHFF